MKRSGKFLDGSTVDGLIPSTRQRASNVRVSAVELWRLRATSRYMP
jgi:hypothetical protein